MCEGDRIDLARPEQLEMASLQALSEGTPSPKPQGISASTASDETSGWRQGWVKSARNINRGALEGLATGDCQMWHNVEEGFPRRITGVFPQQTTSCTRRLYRMP